MEVLTLNQAQTVKFVMIDAIGNEVAGLGGALTIEVSKVGGAFIAGAGAQAETSDGWYEYTLTAAECDTVGPLAIKVDGAGAIQQSLYFFVKSAAAGAVEVTYTVTNSVTLNPIDGVHVWISTDVAGNNVVWSGFTDTFGVARALDATLPWLDVGTYYFWCQAVGYTFVNPDTEVITLLDITGETTGTPITGGVAIGLSLAYPLPYTLLSLPMYAKILSINPLHFSRGSTPGLDPTVMPDRGCNSLWFKYDWQHYEQVSWMSLAESIHTAEKEIADLIGWWPAPVWIEEEVHQYPRPFMRDAYGSGIDIRGQYKSIAARYGKFIQPGTRAVSLEGTATTGGGSLSYTDEDGDGFYETASIVFPTTLTNVSEIKVYFSGQSGAMEWEVRPPRSKEISGGFVTFIFDSWLLINPELYEDFPTSDGIQAIDVSTVANFVATVDVYREYTDTTTTSARFYWEQGIPQSLGMVCATCGGVGCYVCGYIVQDGCLGARHPVRGVLVPAPGVYDTDNSVWGKSTWAECREPDIVKVWYKSGELAQEYIQGRTVDPLSLFWAQTIAWLATARLERPFCGCGSVEKIVNDLQTDMLLNTSDTSYFVTSEVMNCPFGTRKGEVMAWRRIKHFVKNKRLGVAVI